MGTARSTASTIITRARYVLQDIFADNRKWTDAELLLWLAEAQRAVVKARPSAYLGSASVQPSTTALQTAIADPGSIAATSTSLKVHPAFDEVLVNYLLYRAWGKAGESQDMNKSRMHLDIFKFGLGIK